MDIDSHILTIGNYSGGVKPQFKYELRLLESIFFLNEKLLRSSTSMKSFGSKLDLVGTL